MNKDKLMFILDVKEDGKFNKDHAQVLLGVDIGFSVLVVGVGMLFKYICYSILNVIAVSLILLTSVLFLLWYKKIKNAVSKAIYIPSILLKSTLQLFYGYWIFSKGELRDYGYAVFTWVHATVAIAVSIGVIWSVYAYSKLYKDAKNMSLHELVNREATTKEKANEIRRAHPWIVILPTLLPAPYIGSKALAEWSTDKGLGMGFCMWALACIWGLLTSFCLPKLIIYIKHKSLLHDTIL